MDIPKLNKNIWDFPGYPGLWLIPGSSTLVLTYTSCWFFSVEKKKSWYKSVLGYPGSWKNKQLLKSCLVRLTLSILFHTKYQRDIPASEKVTSRDIQGYLLLNWDMDIQNEIFLS